MSPSEPAPSRTRASIRILGVGNDSRSDDGVGPAVVRRAAWRERPGLEVREVGGEPVGLLDAWEGAELAVVVDALDSTDPPGTVHRIEWASGVSGPSAPVTSTHGLSLAEAIGLATALGRLPRRLVVFGVTGSNWEPGWTMSRAVEDAVPRVIRQVEEEIASASAQVRGGDPHA